MQLLVSYTRYCSYISLRVNGCKTLFEIAVNVNDASWFNWGFFHSEKSPSFYTIKEQMNISIICFVCLFWNLVVKVAFLLQINRAAYMVPPTTSQKSKQC